MPVILILILLALFIGIVLVPLGAIWSLNTLFGVGIAFGFWEWLAMLFFVVVFGAGSRSGNNKN
jgi:hypothetical protein